MKHSSAVILIAQILSIICVLLVSVLCVWSAMNWMCIGSACVLLAAWGITKLASARQLGFGKRGLMVALIGLLCGLSLSAYGSMAGEIRDIVAGLVIAAAFLSSFVLSSDSPQDKVHAVGASWVLAADAVWLAFTWERNSRGGFYICMLIAMAFLILAKLKFKMQMAGIQTTNTAILLVVGLPIADLIFATTDNLNTQPSLAERPYSYEFFEKDHAASARWWNYMSEQWTLCGHAIAIDDRKDTLPFRLRPNSVGMLFDSRISINSKGFRGAEIPDEKGNDYRIVALGESTTFGVTLYADDKPWPEILEQMIYQRLKFNRKVQVINAGVYSYDLKDNLWRLKNEILPLKPDMIISYHGHNGFQWIDPAMPAIRTWERPPAYKRRPLKLLADMEYRIKMALYRKRVTAVSSGSNAPSPVDPMDTDYANAYCELIEICRTNGIQLVLSTYSMAVNDQTGRNIFDFYHATVSALQSKVRANAVHTAIVKRLADLNPDIIFVDTQPHLDGEHQKFIDLVHFSPEGEEQITETFFAGIKGALETELQVDVH